MWYRLQLFHLQLTEKWVKVIRGFAIEYIVFHWNHISSPIFAVERFTVRKDNQMRRDNQGPVGVTRHHGLEPREGVGQDQGSGNQNSCHASEQHIPCCYWILKRKYPTGCTIHCRTFLVHKTLAAVWQHDREVGMHSAIKTPTKTSVFQTRGGRMNMRSGYETIGIRVKRESRVCNFPVMRVQTGLKCCENKTGIGKDKEDLEVKIELRCSKCYLVSDTKQKSESQTTSYTTFWWTLMKRGSSGMDSRKDDWETRDAKRKKSWRSVVLDTQPGFRKEAHDNTMPLLCIWREISVQQQQHQHQHKTTTSFLRTRVRKEGERRKEPLFHAVLS